MIEQIIPSRQSKKVEVEQPTPSVVLNVTCTSANTEYSQALPNGTKSITIKSRDYNDIKFTFKATESGSTYMTLNSGTVQDMSGNFSNKTIYVQSPDAGAVVEILCYE